jgi:hypothetical protein
MERQILDHDFSVCQLAGSTLPDDLAGDYVFLAKTDNEISLVCLSSAVPSGAVAVEAGWRAFRVAGKLPFDMVGVLAGIAGILAEAGISVFAVSTYDTDYIFMKDKDFAKGMQALQEAGYSI